MFAQAPANLNQAPGYGHVYADSWDVGTSWRVVPGSAHPTSQTYVNHIMSVCGQPFGANWYTCLVKHGVQNAVLVQPTSHFWALQWGEAGSFVAAGVVLFGLTLWSVRRWRA